MSMATEHVNVRTVGDVEGAQKKGMTQTNARKQNHTVHSVKENMLPGTSSAR